MSQADEPKLLTLAGLAHRCARETDRFFQSESYDPRYCFELFRRAILHRNQRAWELIYEQYRPLVAGWVERHSAFHASDEEAQYFVNRAFEKMWSAVTPEKFDRFPDLKSLLRYLQMCVHSTVVDKVRSPEPPQADVEEHDPATSGILQGPGTEKQALSRAQREDFWDRIYDRLNDEKEHLVIHASYILDLKPREIQAEYQTIFEDVTEIYRIKQNVMARFRRDDELKELLGVDA